MSPRREVIREPGEIQRVKISQIKRAWVESVKSGVLTCRLLADWKDSGGPEELREPELWDRYLGGVLRLHSSRIRHMVAEGRILRRLCEFAQRAELDDLRPFHLAKLVPLIGREDDLLEEAWTSSLERAGEDKRLTAQHIEDSVDEIRAREGFAKRRGFSWPGNPAPAWKECTVCSGKGWTDRP